MMTSLRTADVFPAIASLPSSLLPRAWPRALPPFPFPFERLPRRLAGIAPFQGKSVYWGRYSTV